MQRLNVRFVLIAFLGVVFAGCASTVVGPSSPAFQGRGKTQQEYFANDQYCRHNATTRAQAVQDATNQNTAASGVLGAAGGAATGAAVGSWHGNAGQGAAIGAGLGLLMGALSAASQAQAANQAGQQAYDVAYHACMYSFGHQVPGVAAQQQAPQAVPMPPPPPSYAPPAATQAPPPPPAASSEEACVPTGRSVKVPGGFAPECK